MLKDNLKALRKQKGLSQEELSVKLNVVRQTISKWEQGLSVPDAEMLVSISKIFDTSVSTLLGDYLAGIGWNEYLVTGINMVLNFVTEFLFQRYYVFKDSIDTKVVKL